MKAYGFWAFVTHKYISSFHYVQQQKIIPHTPCRKVRDYFSLPSCQSSSVGDFPRGRCYHVITYAIVRNATSIHYVRLKLVYPNYKLKKTTILRTLILKLINHTFFTNCDHSNRPRSSIILNYPRSGKHEYWVTLILTLTLLDYREPAHQLNECSH